MVVEAPYESNHLNGECLQLWGVTFYSNVGVSITRGIMKTLPGVINGCENLE